VAIISNGNGVYSATGLFERFFLMVLILGAIAENIGPTV
jgi:hypothetical protein